MQILYYLTNTLSKVLVLFKGISMSKMLQDHIRIENLCVYMYKEHLSTNTPEMPVGRWGKFKNDIYDIYWAFNNQPHYKKKQY